MRTNSLFPVFVLSVTFASADMEEPEFYNYAVEDMRSAEFPALKGEGKLR